MREALREFYGRWGEALAYPAILALLGLLAVCAAYCTGCGPGAHAIAAQTMRDAAQEANLRIREDRMEVLRTAGGEARIDGGDIGAAIDAAAARYDAEHAQLYALQQTMAAASTAYSTGAFAAARGSADGNTLTTLAREAARAWVALTRLLRIPELDTFVPTEILQFLGADPEGGTP